jgi:hypothetical protein
MYIRRLYELQQKWGGGVARALEDPAVESPGKSIMAPPMGHDGVWGMGNSMGPRRSLLSSLSVKELSELTCPCFRIYCASTT